MEKFSAFRVSNPSSPHPNPRFTLSGIYIGSGNWHTCASKTKLAPNPKRAQRNPLLKPFLTPVSASGNGLAHTALLPLGIIIGVARVLVVAVVGLLYFLLDSGLSILSVSLSLNAFAGNRAHAVSPSGYPTHPNCETALRYHIRPFHPLRTRVLVDTCRGCQSEERVCRLETPYTPFP